MTTLSAFAVSLLLAVSPQQDSETIRSAIEKLSGSNIEMREEATRTLIRLGAVKEVKPLLASDDVEVKRRAERILRTIKFTGKYKLQELYKSNPNFVETLALLPKTKWLDLISRAWNRDPEFLNPKQRRMFAVELIREKDVLARLKETIKYIGSQNAPVEHLWFYLEMLDLQKGWGTSFLNRVASKLTAEKTTIVVRRLTEMTKSSDPAIARTGAWSFAYLTNQLTPKQAGEIAQTLLGLLKKEDANIRHDASYSLRYMTSKLGPEGADGVSTRLTEFIANEGQRSNWSRNIRSNLCASLGAVVPKLSEKEVARIRMFLLEKLPSGIIDAGGSRPFLEIAKRLDEKSRKAFVDSIGKHLKHEKPPVSSAVIEILSRIADQFGGELESGIVDSLLKAIPGHPNHLAISNFLTRAAGRNEKRVEAVGKALEKLIESDSKHTLILLQYVVQLKRVLGPGARMKALAVVQAELKKTAKYGRFGRGGKRQSYLKNLLQSLKKMAEE